MLSAALNFVSIIYYYFFFFWNKEVKINLINLSKLLLSLLNAPFPTVSGYHDCKSIVI